jgi:hypothetical protein
MVTQKQTGLQWLVQVLFNLNADSSPLVINQSIGNLGKLWAYSQGNYQGAIGQKQSSMLKQLVNSNQIVKLSTKKDDIWNGTGSYGPDTKGDEIMKEFNYLPGQYVKGGDLVEKLKEYQGI